MAKPGDRLREIGDDIDENLIKRINALLTSAEARADEPEKLDAYLMDQLPGMLGTVSAMRSITARIAATQDALDRGTGDTRALQQLRDELLENLSGLAGELRAGTGR